MTVDDDDDAEAGHVGSENEPVLGWTRHDPALSRRLDVQPLHAGTIGGEAIAGRHGTAEAALDNERCWASLDGRRNTGGPE
jgi:hypothetical protein